MSYIIIPSRRTQQPQGVARVDYSIPLSKGLIRYWPLNGRTNDAAVNNDGALVSGAGWGYDVKGASLALDGTDDYFSIPARPLVIGNSFSISAWLYCTAVGTARHTVFGCENEASGFQLEIGQGPNGSGTRAIGTLYSGVAASQTNDSQWSTNTWFHVVCTKNGTGAGANKTYVNGVEKALYVNDAITFVNTVGTRTIGRRVASTQLFPGRIQSLGIWDRPLSAGEVFSLYENPHQVLVNSPRRIFFGTSGGAGVFELDAQPGGYTLSGTAATLARGIVVDAQPGSYALTGTAATLARGYNLNAQPGTYALTGTAATLARGLVVNAGPGSFALTGVAAGLDKTTAGAYSLDAQPGSYALVGFDATLTYTQPTAYTIDAQPGAYSLTGVAATLTYTPLNAYTLDAQPGTFALTGIPATLTYQGASIWTDISTSTSAWSDVAIGNRVLSDGVTRVLSTGDIRGVSGLYLPTSTIWTDL